MSSTLPISLHLNGKVIGPFTVDEVAAMLSENKVTMDTQAYRPDLPDWMPLLDVLSAPSKRPVQVETAQVPKRPRQPEDENRFVPALAVVVGIFTTGYFAFIFPTSVKEILNLGLLNDRLVGVIIGLAISHFGFMGLWRK